MGAVAGALPLNRLGGGRLIVSVILFGILFTWQMPHSWQSLGISGMTTAKFQASSLGTSGYLHPQSLI